MQKILSNQDVREMTTSLMIDLFKRKILEGKQDLQQFMDCLLWEECERYNRFVRYLC